jgi:hypothetical protein
MVLLYKESRVGLISNKKGAPYLKRLKASTLPAKLGSFPYKISTGYTDFGGGDLTISLKVRIS